MRAMIRATLVSFLLLTLLTGIVYPMLVTGVSAIAFPHQAGGSMIERDGGIVGSELIAQPFSDPKYFWPRPSAAGYNGAAGAGSNLSPTNPALRDALNRRTDVLRAADPSNPETPPIDLLTASGSGLDPDITPEAAQYQLSRVARARGISPQLVQRLVDEQTRGRTFGILGEPRVNVLGLNLSLDRIQ